MYVYFYNTNTLDEELQKIGESKTFDWSKMLECGETKSLAPPRPQISWERGGAHADAVYEALKSRSPDSAQKLVTIETLRVNALAITYTEVYAVFRRRTQSKGDRLCECLYTAPTLEQAIDKLIAIAGFGPREAVTLGLDKFGVGDLEDLYQELHRLTGDTYEISPYEEPALPIEDEE